MKYNREKLKNKKTKAIQFNKTWRERAFAYAFLAYPLLLFAIFYVYVNVNSFVLSFQRINLNGTRDFIGIENFKHFLNGLLASEGILKISFTNSLKMYLAGLLVSMPLQILFSYMLFKKCFGHRLIMVLVMLPAIISSLVFCLVFRNFAGAELQNFMKLIGFSNFPNLIESSNHAFGTTLFYSIWVSFSTMLIIYPNAMRSIEPAIFESAQIDGVHTMWQELRHIILPLTFPTITTFIVVDFSAVMSNPGPLIAFYMYEAPGTAYNMGYYMIREVFNGANAMLFPYISAGGMMLTMIVAPLTLLLRWWLEKMNPLKDD